MLPPDGIKIGRGFFAVAKRIATGGHTEADWRSISNRCYYAAFRTCQTIAEQKGYRSEVGRSEHRGLVGFLRGNEDAQLSACGDLLERLRTVREMSDYGTLGGVNRGHAQVALEDAEEIIEEKLIEIMPDLDE